MCTAQFACQRKLWEVTDSDSILIALVGGKGREEWEEREGWKGKHRGPRTRRLNSCPFPQWSIWLKQGQECLKASVTLECSPCSPCSCRRDIGSDGGVAIGCLVVLLQVSLPQWVHLLMQSLSQVPRERNGEAGGREKITCVCERGGASGNYRKWYIWGERAAVTVCRPDRKGVLLTSYTSLWECIWMKEHDRSLCG